MNGSLQSELDRLSDELWEEREREETQREDEEREQREREWEARTDV
jgi:hypothetical protein